MGDGLLPVFTSSAKIMPEEVPHNIYRLKNKTFKYFMNFPVSSGSNVYIQFRKFQVNICVGMYLGRYLV